RVDLPEPDRPITTKTSPGWTSNDTSSTAIVPPVSRTVCSSCSREAPAPAVATFASAGPKTFQRPRTAIVGPPALAAAACPGAAGGTGDGPVTAVPGSTTEVTDGTPDRCQRDVRGT